MPAESMTTYAAMLKEFYSPDRVAKMILKDSPLMAMLTKRSITGESLDIPLLYGGTAGSSATFSTALNNRSETKSGKFVVTTANDYALANVDRKVMLASRDNKGAFMSASRAAIDMALAQIKRSLAISLYREGYGVRAQGATLASGNTVWSLSNKEDAVNFQVGDKIQVAETKTGALRAASEATITKIDRNAGTLTFGADLTSTISGLAATDYIFRSGDHASGSKLLMTGLQGWLPSTAPTSGDSFFGLDRSVDADMLGGVRDDGQGKLLYEALIDGQNQVNTIGGGNANKAFVHPNKFARLIKELEAQATRPRPVDREVSVRQGSKAKVGFSGIVVQGNMGALEVYPDRFCPVDQCFLLQMEDWKLNYIGKDLVDFVNRDSDDGMLLEPAGDEYQIRFVAYPQVSCNAPGHSGVITNFGV